MKEKEASQRSKKHTPVVYDRSQSLITFCGFRINKRKQSFFYDTYFQVSQE